MPARSTEAAVEALARFYEELTPAALARLGEFYAAGAQFKDPFNEVAGVDAIRRMFAHMFATLETPRFTVDTTIVQGRQAMLGWVFRFGLRGRSVAIRGVSHLSLDGAGRVVRHVDYWDAAAGVYERLPLIGAACRLLRRRLAAGAAGRGPASA